MTNPVQPKPTIVTFDDAANARPFANVRYNPADYIGRGELGIVYGGLATLYGQDDVPIVVKVPHSREKYDEVDTEYRILRQLRDRLSDDGFAPTQIPVPEVAKGMVQPALPTTFVLESDDTTIDGRPVTDLPASDTPITTSLEDDIRTKTGLPVRPVLVMPFYDDKALLTKHMQHLLDAGDIQAAESLALTAAIAFTGTMVALHRLDNPRACTDRKIRDFYVFATGAETPDSPTNTVPQTGDFTFDDADTFSSDTVIDTTSSNQQRIVVIDWNVLREDTPAFRIAEIKLFAYLWHELYFARKGRAPYNPYDDDRWQFTPHINTPLVRGGALSVGLRVILARAVDFTPGRDGDPDIMRLYQALQAWQTLHTQYNIPTRADIRAVLTIWVARGDDALLDEEIAAVIADWRWRQNPNDEALWQARDEAMQAAHIAKLGTPNNVLRQEISEKIKYDDPKAVEAHLQTLEQDAATRQDWVRWAHIQRWLVLLRVMNNADNLTSRRRRDVQAKLLDIGDLLHTELDMPEDQALGILTQADTLLREVAQETDLDTTPLQQIELEVDVRGNALSYARTDNIGQRQTILIDMQDMLQALYQQGHYLVGQKTNAQQTGLSDVALNRDARRSQGADIIGMTAEEYLAPKSYLDHLLDQYIVHDLISIFDDIIVRINERLMVEAENPQTDIALTDDEPVSVRIQRFRELDGIALAMVELDSDRDRIMQIITPYRQTLQFIERYNIVDSNLLPALLSDIQTLLATGTIVKTDHRNAVLRLTAHFISNALSHIEQTLTGSNTWQDIHAVSPLYDTLRDNEAFIRSRIPFVMLDDTVLAKYEEILLYFQRWFSTVHILSLVRDDTPDAEQNRRAFLRKLIKLIGLFSTRFKINMEDLLSSELIQEYRHEIENYVDGRLREQLHRIRTEVKTHISEINESVKSMSIIDNRLAEVLQSLDKQSEQLAQRQRVNDQTLAELHQQQTYIEIDRLIDQLDLDALRSRQHMIENEGIQQRIRNAVADMTQLNADETMRHKVVTYFNDNATPVLTQLRNLRDSIRIGNTIPDAAHEFFVDREVLAMARANAVLAGIFDWYWIYQQKAMRDNVRNTPLHIEIIERSQDESRAVAQTLQQVYQAFDDGNFEAAHKLLQSIIVTPDSLTSQLLQDIITTWRLRFSHAQTMHTQLQAINQKTYGLVAPSKQGSPPQRPDEYAHEVRNLTQNLIGTIEACPADAFSTSNKRYWQTVSDALLQKTQSDFKRYEKDDNSERYTSWSYRVVADLSYKLERASQVAQKKHQDYRAIHARNVTNDQ